MSDRSRAVDERFNRLAAAHGPALRRLAATYASPGDRDDLVQDIAVAIWQALPNFRGECSERTFVFRIAHNRGISHLARRRLPSGVQEAVAAIPDGAPTPEAALTREEQSQRLLVAIQRLPLAYRQVITLMLEELSYQEIAQVLGISETNVGARLTRARQMLRAELED